MIIPSSSHYKQCLCSMAVNKIQRNGTDPREWSGCRNAIRKRTTPIKHQTSMSRMTAKKRWSYQLSERWIWFPWLAAHNFKNTAKIFRFCLVSSQTRTTMECFFSRTVIMTSILKNILYTRRRVQVTLESILNGNHRPVGIMEAEFAFKWKYQRPHYKSNRLSINHRHRTHRTEIIENESAFFHWLFHFDFVHSKYQYIESVKTHIYFTAL